jgi:hypothetical protein
MTVRVEGAGNVKTFSKPRLPDLPQFKTYDSDSKTDVQATDRVAGSRTYEVVLVPKDEGEHDLPPLRMAYFDTREGRYRTLETKPLHITAVKSSHPDHVADAGAPGQQQDIRILGKDIAHIRTDVPVRDALTPLYRRGLFAAMLPLPLLAVVGATLVQRRRERLATDVALARATRARKMAKKHLAAAEASMRAGNGESFYADVSRALRQYVGDKLNIAATGMTHDQLRGCMLGAGAPPDRVEQTIAMLERCDAARFAPGSMGGEQLRETLAAAESLLVALHGGWAKRSAGRAGVLAAWILAAALAAGLSPARAQEAALSQNADFASPQLLLQRAHQAYEAGRFGEAVEAYRRAEQQGVRNGALYYDLGNAYFKNRQLGLAIASYRRAEMLEPRDPQVRANLEFARARREDKALQTRDTPFVAWVRSAFRWLSLNEWILVTCGLYVLACGLWIVRTLRHDRGLGLRRALYACAGLGALSLLVLGFKVRTERGQPQAVVTVSKVDVTSGPGSSYTAEFSLHEGAEVRVEEKRPEWLRISLGEKLRGWVPAASVAPI